VLEVPTQLSGFFFLLGQGPFEAIDLAEILRFGGTAFETIGQFLGALGKQFQFLLMDNLHFWICEGLLLRRCSNCSSY